jgi:hypothetical protein
MIWISLGPVVNTANHLQRPDWADTSHLSEALNYDSDLWGGQVIDLIILHVNAKK